MRNTSPPSYYIIVIEQIEYVHSFFFLKSGLKFRTFQLLLLKILFK